MRLASLFTHFVCASIFVFAHDAGESAPATPHRTKLALIIPTLFGESGLVLPNPTHLAHFDSAFRNSFGPFNTSIASQLTSLPIPSPASGFTYTFDKSLGTSTRSAQSFGPILTERAETIGKDKFFFGFAYQAFRFDSIDGVNLSRVPVVFQHAVAANPLFAQDVVSSENLIDLRVGQFTSYFTFGISDRIDVSVAAPLITTTLSATSRATIRRFGTGSDDTVHFFNTPDKTTAQFSGSGSAAGIGDLVVRLKGTAYRNSWGGLALGLDLRAPTGDEYNFLGSGATGIKPFAALSLRRGRTSPHVNFAYQWNGQSVLGGNVANGEKAKLPNELSFAAGADIGISPKFTFAGDLLGLARSNAPRVESTLFRPASGGSALANIDFRRGSLSQYNGSLGFKINGVRNLLFAFNVLFKLNDDGLRGRITPLVSLSYTL